MLKVTIAISINDGGGWMRLSHMLRAAVAASLACVGGWAKPPTRYHLYALELMPHAINNADQVVGKYYVPSLTSPIGYQRYSFTHRTISAESNAAVTDGLAALFFGKP